MKKSDLENITLESAEKEILRVWGTPYGHNIIAIILKQVHEKFGEDEALKLYYQYQV